jgi:hypothetical protein
MKTFLLASSLVVLVLVASTALGSGRHATACATAEGQVQSYLPSAAHACSTTILVGATLFRSETLSTGSPGKLKFSTSVLYQCEELSSTQDVLRPSAAIALRHVSGTTFCRRQPKGKKVKLTIPNATITTVGTTFGLVTDENGTLVKVTEGALLVRTVNPPQTAKVTQGQQEEVPIAGPPVSAGPVGLSGEEQESLTELRLGVLEMGVTDVPQHLASRHEHSALVVGPDTDTATNLAAQLAPAKTLTMTSDQVLASPTAAKAALAKIRAGSVVTTGDFDLLVPVWTALRKVVPSSTAIVYVPQ